MPAGHEFQCFELSHVKSEANFAAHLCAKHALSSRVVEFFTVAPEFLTGVVRCESVPNLFNKAVF